MTDLLLELRSEEIPARMQPRACADLARLFAEQLAFHGLTAAIETHATPRRLALIARNLPEATQTTTEERRGPRADAPAQALEGFLKSTGLTRDQLEERTDKKGSFLYAVLSKPGRPTADALAEAVPAIVRAFPWPKSMRWGAASLSTESPRWVRPLQGIVALFGEQVVPIEIAGVTSGAATLGHRFHHPGTITIGSADDYEAKLRACHVILRAEERAAIIREGATAAAQAAGLTLVPDEGLVAENAGLTEWPVPLLGRFDPAFLDVPPAVIQLTMRTNQKYFSLTHPPRAALGEGDRPAQSDGGGAPPSDLRSATSPSKLGEDLAPNFICTANIAATDGGAAIVRGNERVLSARLSDAKFFWEADLKVPLEEQARKLDQIVFHEKLGTVADKVDRMAKLARWLVEEGIVKSSSSSLGEVAARSADGGARSEAKPEPSRLVPGSSSAYGGPPPRAELEEEKENLATLAERAARLCKADLVTQMVGEFPELQGTIGAHLARAQGEPPEVADAIRDHYKPVGQGDEVPTAPVTVAVSLADKLDSLFGFFNENLVPTGSKDPFALRRAAFGVLQCITTNQLRIHMTIVIAAASHGYYSQRRRSMIDEVVGESFRGLARAYGESPNSEEWQAVLDRRSPELENDPIAETFYPTIPVLLDFFADRLKVQQREAGVRHDLIDAVFALGGEDDLVRLLARVRALQAFVETPEGADLLAGYKRAANILKKEGYSPSPQRGEGDSPPGERGEGAPNPLQLTPDTAHPHPTLSLKGEGSEVKEGFPLPYTPEPAEEALMAALDSAEPRARDAIAREDFAAAMAALASLRAPVDAFFDGVTVNDPDPAKREARLTLLARMRAAVHAVADFSKIEG